MGIFEGNELHIFIIKYIHEINTELKLLFFFISSLDIKFLIGSRINSSILLTFSIFVVLFINLNIISIILLIKNILENIVGYFTLISASLIALYISSPSAEFKCSNSYINLGINC